MPKDFVIFARDRMAIFRMKLRPDGSWDMLIRRDCWWALHDNGSESTAKEYHTNQSHEIFVGYE